VKFLVDAQLPRRLARFLQLFQKHLDRIISLFKTHRYIELGQDSVIVHQ